MKKSILIQLDTDPHPSVFDSVVAVDSGVDHLFRHGGVTPEAVRNLVYGGLFTRGLDDLKRTAVFVGGSDVAAGESILKAVRDSFFGPFRLSVLLDSNGANTTAAAAVLAAERTLGSLKGVRAAVLAATGPVGRRAARLLARAGARVAVASRKLDAAQAVAADLARSTSTPLEAFATSRPDDLTRGLADAQLIIAAGAAGVTLLPLEIRRKLPALKVAIDLNAVPPAGIEGIEPTDKNKPSDGILAWGALGVGGLKMKIHTRALQRLFESNDQILDADEVFDLGKTLG